MRVDEAWLSAASDAEEGAALTASLIAHPSYPGAEAPVQEEIASWLRAAGLQPNLQEAAPGRLNVVARVVNGPGPTLLLNGHVDTVLAVNGWSSDPWQPRRDGDRLYGLGACDMKAGVAAAMLATRALASRPDRWRGTVIFTSVVDEEAYSLGARALLASNIEADACIVMESSWERPCLGSVGKVLCGVDVTGKAAHASWPATGINAAVEASRFVSRLDVLPVGTHSRLTATRCVLSLHSGSAQYVITVPERARVLINRMIVPGETAASVRDELEGLVTDIDSEARFAVTVEPPYYPPWETPVDHPLVESFADAYARETGQAPAWGYTGFGDANLFSGEAGIPTIQFGPHGAAFHQADEWVDVPSIGGAVRVLLQTALGFLKERAGAHAT